MGILTILTKTKQGDVNKRPNYSKTTMTTPTTLYYPFRSCIQLVKKKDFEKLKGHQLLEVTKKLKMSAGLNNLNFKYIYSIGKIVKQKILSS